MIREHCKDHDLENVIRVSRACWYCPVCEHDVSVEYYFWFRATHPELLDKPPNQPD